MSRYQLHTEERIAQLEAEGFVHQSNRISRFGRDGWLVFWANPETWEHTTPEFVPDDDEEEDYEEEE